MRVTLGGEHVDQRLPGRKGRLLFAALMLNRRRSVTRGELFEILWPRDRPLSADGALSTLLTRLRQAAGENIVEGRTELRLRLPAGTVVDIDEAEARVAAAQTALEDNDIAGALAHARIAAELAVETLLPEFDEDAILDLRRDYDELAALALELLARAGLAAGRDQLVIAKRAARQLIVREPYLESGYALLMRAHGQAGDAAEALRVFERLRVLLRDELGTTPSATVLEIHQRLLSGEPEPAPKSVAPRASEPAAPRDAAAPAPGVPLPPGLARVAERPFVARADQLATLARHLEEARDGNGGLVLLSGEPGAGKTTLAAQFAVRAHAGGAAVLHGRCEEHSVVPYQPLAQAVRFWCRAQELSALPPHLAPLTRLVPELADLVTGQAPDTSSGFDDDRFATFEAVGALLAMAAGGEPLVLILDDLHWADQSTLALVRHLLQGSAAAHMLIVATYRDDELDPEHSLQEAVADLSRQPQVERVPVGAFAERESAELIATYLGATPDPVVTDGWQRRTDGHPFFLHELLRSAAPDEITAPGAVSVPTSVRELIERRVYRLGGRTANVLSSAAVIGREFSIDVLTGLTGDSGEAILSALEEGVGTGLLVEVPDHDERFAFGHALIRETLYQGRSRARRTRLHQQVGELLLRSSHDVPAAELAHHFLCAQPVAGHEPAVRYCERAGDVAFAAAAYEEAVAHYGRALAALELAGPEVEAMRCDLLLAEAEARWRAGDEAADATFARAAESARERGDSGQLARAALGGRNHESGLPDPARVALLSEALELLGADPDVQRVKVMGRLSEALHFAGQTDRALALSGVAVAEAEALGDDEAQLAALMGRHAALLHVAHVAERLTTLRSLLELSERQGRDDVAAHARQWTTYALLEVGDLAAARAEHRGFDALAEQLNQPGYTHVALAWRAMFAALDGDLERTERLAVEGAELAQYVHGIDAAALFGGQLFFIRRAQGRLGELIGAIEAFVEANALPTWRATLVVAHGATGALDQARAAFEHAAEQDFENVAADMWWLTTMVLFAQGCAYIGAADRAAQLYRMLEPYADRNVQVAFAAHLGSVAAALVLLATLMGRDDLAVTHQRAADARDEPIADAPLLVQTRAELGHLRPETGGGREVPDAVS